MPLFGITPDWTMLKRTTVSVPVYIDDGATRASDSTELALPLQRSRARSSTDIQCHLNIEPAVFMAVE